MPYNEQGNTSGSGATGNTTSGYGQGGGTGGGMGESGANTQMDVLDDMNAPTYTSREDRLAGGYREHGFGNNDPSRTSTIGDIHGTTGYGANTLGKDRYGRDFTASASFWTLRTSDRQFLSEDFIPVNTMHIKRLQNILGRTETGIMDAFTMRKYRALMGNPSNSGKFSDVYGYGRGGRNVGDIRRKIDTRGGGGGKRSGPRKKTGFSKFLDDPLSVIAPAVNEAVDFATGIDLGMDGEGGSNAPLIGMAGDLIDSIDTSESLATNLINMNLGGQVTGFGGNLLNNLLGNQNSTSNTGTVVNPTQGNTAGFNNTQFQDIMDSIFDHRDY